jgi:cell division protein FtsN
MTEQSFREIQLSGKQLVFLFMTAVVIAVGVFLLGVSVGRGVRGNMGLPAGANVERTAEVRPPENIPPQTEMTPEDQAYHETLRGETTPPAQPQPPPVEPPDPPAESIDEPALTAERAPQPAAAPVPAPSTTTSAPATTTAPTAKPAPPAAAAGGWFVQVGAYGVRENADRQARQLTAKGYAASVAAPAATGGLFRVRVGPFSQRAEADRTATRLRREEGMTPSVTR